MHKTFDEIRSLQQSVAQVVEVGARYQHSKSGGVYIVQGFVTIEATD